MGVGSEHGLQDAGQLLSDNPVDVTEGDVFDVEQLRADPVHHVVLMHQDAVRQLVEMSQRQHRVVVLDNHLTEWVREEKLKIYVLQTSIQKSTLDGHQRLYLPSPVRPCEMVDDEGRGVGVSEALSHIGTDP